VLESLRPISDVQKQKQKENDDLGNGNRESTAAQRTLYVKLNNEDSPEYERLKLIHMMIIHFNDTKKSVGAKCIIHEAFLEELKAMLGAGNVVIR
jgi:hypothetical protein